jgi:hypothetical protein
MNKKRDHSSVNKASSSVGRSVNPPFCLTAGECVCRLCRPDTTSAPPCSTPFASARMSKHTPSLSVAPTPVAPYNHTEPASDRNGAPDPHQQRGDALQPSRTHTHSMHTHTHTHLLSLALSIEEMPIPTNAIATPTHSICECVCVRAIEGYTCYTHTHTHTQYTHTHTFSSLLVRLKCM